MDSFVFTRHSSDCKFKRDRFCNRCNCPKWVEGRFNHERFRKSASTRVWGEAEQFREKLEEALSRGLPQTVFTRTRSRHLPPRPYLFAPRRLNRNPRPPPPFRFRRDWPQPHPR